jgi:predicted DNA-binding WGR domain protein
MGRYWQISYEGIQLMQVWAKTQKEAKQSAIRTYQREGRRGMNPARLQAS